MFVKALPPYLTLSDHTLSCIPAAVRDAGVCDAECDAVSRGAAADVSRRHT